jgi:hypothetical protein
MQYLFKNIVNTVFFVCTAQICMSQITKNVGDFSSLSVFDKIKVELVQNNLNSVQISGKKSQDVEIINNNGQLKIRMKFEKLLKGDDIEVKLNYTTLEQIEATEGSFISSNETFKNEKISLNAKEGAEIKLNLDAKELEVRSVTGASIELSGSAVEVDAKLGTGGILRADELDAERVKVSVNTGGEASVRASKKVQARVNAGGDILIYGDPDIDQKITLGGSVRKAN